MKWAKKHSHLSSELPVISLLHTDIEEITQIIIISENKTKMLWNWFFSSELKADLNDMKKYRYSLKVKMILWVSEMNVWYKLYRLQNTMSNLNSILNEFLKIINQFFVKAMTVFMQMSWNVAYYLKRFQITCTVIIWKLNKSNYIISDM